MPHAGTTWVNYLSKRNK